MQQLHGAPQLVLPAESLPRRHASPATTLGKQPPLGVRAPRQGSKKGVSSPRSGSAAGSHPPCTLRAQCHTCCAHCCWRQGRKGWSTPAPSASPRPALAVIGITLAPGGGRPHLHAPADPEVPNPSPCNSGWAAARLLLVVPRLDQPTSSLLLIRRRRSRTGPNPAAKPSACPQPQPRRKPQRRQDCAAGQATAGCACAVSSPPIDGIESSAAAGVPAAGGTPSPGARPTAFFSTASAPSRSSGTAGTTSLNLLRCQQPTGLFSVLGSGPTGGAMAPGGTMATPGPLPADPSVPALDPTAAPTAAPPG